MMLNLVRLRYGDIGVFLDVGQIVSGYTVESVVSASAFWNLFGFSIEHPNVPNNTVAASVGGRFTDRPTITYTPLMGERFARSMMTPVPPASVLSLIQAGYPVDLVLRLMVNVVNGLDNRHGGDLRARPPAHVAEQRVSPMAGPDQGPSGPLRPLLQIKSSRERPADAFVMVPYRDYWFWIDDRDIPSKRMFSFIMFIFTLVEPGSKEAPPVLTIPTG